ncbi:MAG: hypothetical protein GY801_23630 [bacterium]|nr:hypothetical protein [bacterium]
MMQKSSHTNNHCHLTIPVKESFVSMPIIGGGGAFLLALLMTGGAYSVSRLWWEPLSFMLLCIIFSLNMAVWVYVFVQGLLRKTIEIDMTPGHVQISTRYHHITFGKKIRLATKELSPSSFHIRYASRESDTKRPQPMLGINHKQRTVNISGYSLSLQELQQIRDEMVTFLVRYMPSASALRNKYPFQQRDFSISSTNTHTRLLLPSPPGIMEYLFAGAGVLGLANIGMFSLVEGKMLLSFSLLPIVLFPFISAGGLLALRRHIKQVIEITDTDVWLKKEWLSRQVEERQHIPRAMITPEHIVWYFGETAGGSNMPILGINAQQKTYEIPCPRRCRDAIESIAQTLQMAINGTLHVSGTHDGSEQFSSVIMSNEVFIDDSNKRPSFASLPAPHGTNIMIHSEGDEQVTIRIPGCLSHSIRASLAVRLFFLFFGGMIGSIFLINPQGDVSTLYVVVAGLLCAGVLGVLKSLQSILGLTTLMLSPTLVTVRYELFGVGFSRTLTASSVTDAHIASYGYIRGGGNRCSITGVAIDSKSPLNVFSALRFGSHLQQDEMTWLVQVVQAFVQHRRE